MESINTNHRSVKSLLTATHKDKLKHLFITQEQTIFLYLQDHTATASMISEETGIPQKNITRYKRDLEKKGLLFEIERKICKVTGFRAWYLTTNKNFVK